jgi:hypothetical protein
VVEEDMTLDLRGLLAMGVLAAEVMVLELMVLPELLIAAAAVEVEDITVALVVQAAQAALAS